jgi:hypothetical protein
VDNPWEEDLHAVLPFSKYYHHTKFQVTISYGCRVLEAIPSERQDAMVFGRSMVAQKTSPVKNKNFSALTFSLRISS